MALSLPPLRTLKTINSSPLSNMNIKIDQILNDCDSLQASSFNDNDGAQTFRLEKLRESYVVLQNASKFHNISGMGTNAQQEILHKIKIDHYIRNKYGKNTPTSDSKIVNILTSKHSKNKNENILSFKETENSEEYKIISRTKRKFGKI